MLKDKASANVAVVSALKAESKTLSQHSHCVNPCTSGMGGDAVNQCLDKLALKDISGLISWGVCGALKPTLKSGDLLIPNAVMNQQRQIFECDENWRSAIQNTLRQSAATAELMQHMGLDDSLIIDSTAVIENTQDKITMAEDYDAHAVDMESFTIARFAHQHQLPFVIIRTVIDGVNDSLPSCSQFKLGQSAVSFETLTRIMTTPRQWPALIHTGKQFNNAVASLTLVANTSIEALRSPTAQPNSKPLEV